MKWDIQQKIMKEFSGMPDEQAHKIQMERVSKSPILGDFYKKTRTQKESLINRH